ncbi:unnamed protein product [Rotaria sp. Silwood2]|nr:unnamed protein product [Rotaria sp. Silwood2]CAF3407380.1 unnamed protein product [Rotaria sp. Silwood2]CAF4374733.1 unnamed protein product [Rotaria sp. Silwood2]CAF4455501.1 unnamed protein product [Rotaria sp. Silwood2]
MSTGSQQKRELDVPQNGRQLSSEDNVQSLESLSHASGISTSSIDSMSTSSQNNERYLSQQLRTTNTIVNLVDCMECYVKVERCTFEYTGCITNGTMTKDITIELKEQREEQEVGSEQQENQIKTKVVEAKDEYPVRPDNLQVKDTIRNVTMTSFPSPEYAYWNDGSF